MIRLSPGDPATARLGAGADPAAIAALRKQLKLDMNPLQQLISYIVDLLHGNLGTSLQFGSDVFETIRRTLPLTLTYIFFSAFFPGSRITASLTNINFFIFTFHVHFSYKHTF